MDKIFSFGVLIGVVLFYLTYLSGKNKVLFLEPQGEMEERASQKSVGVKSAVLIMASYRGGSTLAGEFFNRNPNVLYYFGKSINYTANFIFAFKFQFPDGIKKNKNPFRAALAF